MKSADIRESFLSFFESKGHTRVPSSSLVPANDPTLLFTNAGMNQFKDCFLGYEKRPYSRATSSQKCVRAGGKHNDLENVGYTARHHTFFEMLGNFSFGDYFKREAIHFAWEFLTSAERLALPPEKLWVTVYAEDDEAYRIWTEEVGVPASRLVRIGDNKDERYASDNFWAMGDTGPCGPCTEIFYDHGPEIWGGPPGSPDEDGDRYVEIWNLVFMQYNRSADGTMEPLPKPSVDTGMGLERIAAVMQGANSNYDIDLFVNLVNAAAEVIGCPNNGDPSLRVLADHIRSCSFLIADGVLPSNEGRGFVLRRIIRRACRHGHKLGAKGEFFYRLVPALVAEMGDAFPELKTQQTHIERALRSEEELFAKTLDKGLKILDQELIELPGKLIPGALVFKLSDTYGFPADLTNDIARERGFSIDEAGFEQEMQAQRERARSASNFTADYGAVLEVQGETRFLGYQSLTGGGAVVALLIDGHAVDGLMEGQDGVVVLGQTPFYGQSGGQVGDRGYLEAPDVLFEVTDTTKSHGVVLHHGRLLKGCLRQGSSLAAKVNAEWRQAISLNHSATHLLHAALRKILGTHVHQKGSLVNSQRLRFDFSHFEPVSTAQLQAIESLVNSQVRANSQVQTEVTDIQTAKAKGAIALFDEKYSDQVRVLTMGDGFSVELCGGTHVARTGDIGLFKIVSESSVQSGVRRIEALTGGAAVAHVAAMESQLHQLAGLLKSTPEGAEEKLTSLLEANRQLDREVQQFKARAASDAGDRLADSAQDIQGIKVLAARLDDAEGDTMMKLVDQLKNKLGSAVVLLASVQEDKVILVAGVTQNLTDSFKAGDLIKQVAPLVGGKGGGRPDMARGGGNNPAGLDEALQQAVAFVQEQV